MFRGDLQWENFVKCIVENFKKKDKINIINAACSDGSEVYSLVITIKENLPLELHKKLLPINAYDYDKEIIRAAKSGFLSVSAPDLTKIKRNTIDENIYFDDRYENINFSIKNDATTSQRKTIKAKKTLRDEIKFEQKNVFDILNELEDNSDTVLMFRNALGHLIPREQQKFVELASEKLKSGSLLVIGDFDKNETNIGALLPEYGFTQIMENVYRKNDEKTDIKTFFQKILTLFA
jgi:chemotaxis methyl-accepting protein methylase